MVLLAIFQLFPVSDRSVGLADRTTQANHLARTLMEKQLSRDYTDIIAEEIEGQVVMNEHTRRKGQALSTEFVWRVNIARPTDPPYNDKELWDILVTVSWKAGAEDETRPSEVKLQSVKGMLW